LLLTDLRKAVSEPNLPVIESIVAKLDNINFMSNHFLSTGLTVKRLGKLLKWRVETKSMKEAEAIVSQFDEALNYKIKLFHELY